jgi:hypothetical protein
MNSKMMKNVGLVALVLVAIAVAVYYYQKMSAPVMPPVPVMSEEMTMPEEVAMEDALAATEGFANQHHMREGFANQHHMREGFNAPAEAQQGSDPAAVEPQPSANNTQLPSECYPKDVLTSADLLPRDANSLHAQVVPSGQGALTDQNFLTAGYHIGINTVGQTLRNANRQLRSEPPNPQQVVSPWLQTTIEPDINRRPLEIGGQ